MNLNEWSVEIVRARFVEAADTERRLPRTGGGSSGGFWPRYEYSFEDKAGWGTERLAEEREMRFQRLPPSSAAISRHDEVMTWTAEILQDERIRRVVWAWSWCRLSGSSFSARCRKRGWAKATAYRRLEAAMERISGVLGNGGTLLRLPDEVWLRQENPDMAHIHDRLAVDVAKSVKSSSSHFSEKPQDLLNSQEAVDEFAEHLADVNKRRRKEQARRRKLGIGDAA